MISDARRRYARKHAKNRAEERFGIDLNHETHRAIRDVIGGSSTEGKVLACLEKTLRGRRTYRITFRGRVIRLIWDRPRRTVVTLLPQDEIDLLLEKNLKAGTTKEEQLCT